MIEFVSVERRRARWIRRVRRWWRETPAAEIGQDLMGVGLMLVVVAALIVFSLR